MGQIIMILILLLQGILLIVFRDFVRKHDKTISLIIGVLLIISRIWRGNGYILDGEAQRAIPMQLCSISTYIALFYFTFNIKQLEPYLFFFGFLGLTSFIDPDVAWSDVRLSYIYGFVVDHLVITLAPLYLVFIRKFKYNAKDILVPYIIVVVLLLISWPLNYMVDGANYFYIVKKPVFSDLFDGSNMNKYVFDFLYILAFQFAFFVFNTVNFLILWGVHLLTKDQTKTFLHN